MPLQSFGQFPCFRGVIEIKRCLITETHAVRQVVGVDDTQGRTVQARHAIEMFVQFLVVESHVNQCMTLLANEVVNLGVVIALVLSAEDEHGGCGHGTEGVETTIDIGGFGVVDETDAVFLAYELQPVLYSGKRAQGGGDDGVVDTRFACGERGGSGVEAVVHALQTEFGIGHGERGVGSERAEGGLTYRTIAMRLLFGGVEFAYFLHDDGVALPVDERVIGLLVAGDTHLGVHVVLETEIVAVEVVGGDVHQYGDMCAETVHIVQLEGTEFDHVPLLVVQCHLQGEGLADIASEPYVVACAAENVVDKRGGGCFAVGACDADELRAAVSGSELYLGKDGCAQCCEFLYQRCRGGDAG